MCNDTLRRVCPAPAKVISWPRLGLAAKRDGPRKPPYQMWLKSPPSGSVIGRDGRLSELTESLGPPRWLSCTAVNLNWPKVKQLPESHVIFSLMSMESRDLGAASDDIALLHHPELYHEPGVRNRARY